MCILNDDAARLYKNDKIPPPKLNLNAQFGLIFCGKFPESIAEFYVVRRLPLKVLQVVCSTLKLFIPKHPQAPFLDR